MKYPKAKGYKLSKNYSLLWKLINKGYRIPAWIVYSKKYARPIYDLVEVKFIHGRYQIGTRGIGYEGWTDKQPEEEFKLICKNKELKFILPEIA